MRLTFVQALDVLFQGIPIRPIGYNSKRYFYIKNNKLLNENEQECSPSQISHHQQFERANLTLKELPINTPFEYQNQCYQKVMLHDKTAGLTSDGHVILLLPETIVAQRLY